MFWFVSIKWHTRHRRRGRPAQHQAAAAADCSACDIDLKSNQAFFYFVLVLLALVLLLLWRLVHSPFGRVLRAIKQNEMRAAFVGHNVWLYKWAVFVHLGGGVGAGRRRCSRWRSSRPTPT